MLSARFTRVVLATSLLQGALFASASAHAQAADPAPPLPPPAYAPPAAAPPPAARAPADDEDDDSRAGRRRARRRDEAYVVDYDNGGPVPAGYHEETRARRGLVIGGAILFGVTYFFSTLAAALSYDEHTSDGGHLGALYIPVVGPFIQTGSVDSSSGRYLCVVDGLAQAGGLAMFVYGIASPRTVLVRDGFGIQTLLPRPYVTAHGGGFGLSGQF